MDTTNLGFTFDMAPGKSSIVKVIGVGGGGNNAVKYMFEKGIQGVDFIVCNTDGQTLQNSPIGTKIQLGVASNEGLGAGSDPEVGEKAALESIEDLKVSLGSNTKMLFITAGMGGGTGTGAAPVVAKIARDMGILTVAIVTIPFRSEGKRRMDQAKAGLEKLKANVDSIIVVNNDKLIELYPNFSFRDAFSKADEVLCDAAKGMAELITGYFHINVDFRDAKSVLENSGTALMTIGVGTGENRASDAINNALDSPLLNDNNIKGAKKALVLLRGGDEDVLIKEYDFIMEHLKKYSSTGSDVDIDVISGIGTDEKLGDALSVLVIATGFNENEIKFGNNEKKTHVLEEEKTTQVIENPLISNETTTIVEDLSATKPIFVLDESENTPMFEFPLEDNTINKTNSNQININPQEDVPNFVINDDFKAVESNENKKTKLKIEPENNKENINDINTLFTFDSTIEEEIIHTNKFVFTDFEKTENKDLSNEKIELTEENFPTISNVPIIEEENEKNELKSELEIQEKIASTEKLVNENPNVEENSVIMQRREKLKEFNSRYKKPNDQYDFDNIPSFFKNNKK